jgi:hypothetical protein
LWGFVCVDLKCAFDLEYKSAARTSIHLARLRVLRLLFVWIEFHEYDVSEKRFSSLLHSFLETVAIAGYEEEEQCKELCCCNHLCLSASGCVPR